MDEKISNAQNCRASNFLKDKTSGGFTPRDLQSSSSPRLIIYPKYCIVYFHNFYVVLIKYL